jgi:L-histidine N-alpha-methyltransferase
MTTLDRRLPPGFLEEALRADARTGLTAEPKSLPPKWFYDAQGSALFDKITELPEYYPTRAEREILRANAAGIAAQTSARTLIELGSGSSDKTRLLLDALRDAGTLRCYVPVDVSEPALAAAGKALSAEYPGLDVRAVVSDFEERLGFPADGEAPGPRLVAFLGSTIGNLEPGQRSAFLARVRGRLRPGDFFLLGTDLVKDPATLIAAYDDEAGVTAEFNKNVLAVLNAELGADFDLDAFEHVAVWDAAAEWIEMRLRARMAQTVRLPGIGLTVEFADGEEMRTEVSAKFLEQDPIPTCRQVFRPCGESHLADRLVPAGQRNRDCPTRACSATTFQPSTCLSKAPSSAPWRGGTPPRHGTQVFLASFPRHGVFFPVRLPAAPAR